MEHTTTSTRAARGTASKKPKKQRKHSTLSSQTVPSKQSYHPSTIMHVGLGSERCGLKDLSKHVHLRQVFITGGWCVILPDVDYLFVSVNPIDSEHLECAPSLIGTIPYVLILPHTLLPRLAHWGKILCVNVTVDPTPITIPADVTSIEHVTFVFNRTKHAKSSLVDLRRNKHLSSVTFTKPSTTKVINEEIHLVLPRTCRLSINTDAFPNVYVTTMD